MKPMVSGKAKERWERRSSPNSALCCISTNFSVDGSSGSVFEGGGASVATESPRVAGAVATVDGGEPGLADGDGLGTDMTVSDLTMTWITWTGRHCQVATGVIQQGLDRARAPCSTSRRHAWAGSTRGTSFRS